MSVKLIFDESLFDSRIPGKTLDVQGKTIHECLDTAFRKQPDLRNTVLNPEGGLHSGVYVRINGKTLYADILDSTVTIDDQIEIVHYAGA